MKRIETVRACTACWIAPGMWEWTADRFDPAYYKNAPGCPPGPEQGDGRTLRGGSWTICQECLFCADRGQGVPNARYDGLGFRVVVSRQLISGNSGL
ncbi:MAG: SUMF1/EgtB/PvdO family nonheme iron enzyme [Caldilineaceae bacterium]